MGLQCNVSPDAAGLSQSVLPGPRPLRLRFGRRGLDLCEVDLPHHYHRLERARGFGTVGAGRQLDQPARGDLPGMAPAVLAPAAVAFLAAVAGDGIPVAVSFLLAVGQNP